MEKEAFCRIRKRAAASAVAVALASAALGYYREHNSSDIVISRDRLSEPLYEQNISDPPEDPESYPKDAETKLWIDLNSADSEELQKLKGIGPLKAKRIIEYRELFGGFVCIEELMEVKGIGPGIFEKIKEDIYVSTEKTGQDK